MRASELGPAWPGFVKRSRQTHPRVGGRFGILRPFNVSSEAFNWTACPGAVEIFKLSAGAGANGRDERGASMLRCVC